MDVANTSAPTLTMDSAIEHGLDAEVCPAGVFRSRLSITAKTAGDLLRFLAACGMDYTSKADGAGVQEWVVRDQTGNYRGSVLTADCAPGYALFSGASF